MKAWNINNIIKFKNFVIFWQQRFTIKIEKLCDYLLKNIS